MDYVRCVLNPQMEALKQRYFFSHPDEPIIFHRKEMVNALPPFEALKNDEIRRAFDQELLGLLKSWEYRVISVSLDKKAHKEKYTIWQYDPYHYLLAVLLERFVFFLNHIGSVGDVMAESRGKPDRRLKNSFSSLWEKGTDYVKPRDIQKVLTSKQLKVKLKANNISGLQLADLLAHPSRNEILKEQGFLMKLPPFAEKVVKILQNKYDRKGCNIYGYGKKFI